MTGLDVSLLYDQYRLMVAKYVRLHSRNSPYSADLIQDVWERVTRSVAKYEDRGGDIGAWILTIARNRIIDHGDLYWFRKVVLTDDDAVLDHADRQGYGPESRVLATDLRPAVQLISSLEGRQRRCLELRYLVGLEVSEAAAVMGIREGALKQLQLRALTKLRDQASAGRIVR